MFIHAPLKTEIYEKWYLSKPESSSTVFPPARGSRQSDCILIARGLGSRHTHMSVCICIWHPHQFCAWHSWTFVKYVRRARARKRAERAQMCLTAQNTNSESFATVCIIPCQAYILCEWYVCVCVWMCTYTTHTYTYINISYPCVCVFSIWQDVPGALNALKNRHNVAWMALSNRCSDNLPWPSVYNIIGVCY